MMQDFTLRLGGPGHAAYLTKSDLGLNRKKMDRCNFSLSGIKVLVVDDEPFAREGMQELLSFYEARVLIAFDGTDGLDQVHKHKPDVIVSDIIRPLMDGYHFIREVRGLGPHNGGRTPAVALTGLNRPKDRTRAIEAGYQYHLVKPFDIDVLVYVLVRLSEKMQ